MSFLSSIFSKFKKASSQPYPLAPLNQSIGKYETTDDVPVKIRRSQINNPVFIEEVLNVCKSNQEIQSCFLLDARTGEDEEIKLIIALTLDNERTQMDRVAGEFQAMFKRFPKEAKNAIILSAGSFKTGLAGTELYIREQV